MSSPKEVLIPWAVFCIGCTGSGWRWTNCKIYAIPDSNKLSLDSVVMSELTVNESDGLRSID